MYVATLTFISGSTMYKAGEDVPNPDERLIAAGLVKETKTETPKEIKQEAKPKTKKAD